MVWAAIMGLPLSLEGVGAVLGLEKQKLTEGKDLIKYFSVPCAPTKANGGRTRNHPFHAPDKWEAFKKYNIRNVETEIGIKDRLAKFPVPEEVWDEYHIDQEINDRGVRLDMDLVKKAIKMDSRSRSELTAAMKDMTALDNPNSVQQMKQWLSDNGLETDSLGKKVVADLSKPLLQSFRPFWSSDSSLQNPPSKNTRRWNGRSVMTAELAACSHFTEPTVPGAGRAGLYNYKTSRKIISRIWPMHVLL